MDLIELLMPPEGKTLEHKRDFSSPEGLLKTVVALGNTAGGILAIGIEDGTRRVIGVPDILATEERLASMIADSVRPLLVPARCERWAAGRPAGREPDVAKERAHG